MKCDDCGKGIKKGAEFDYSRDDHVCLCSWDCTVNYAFERLSIENRLNKEETK